MAEKDSDIRAAQAGDHGAFERLARREGPRLFAIAARVLRDRGLAEDAVQETFLRVVEGRAPVRERGFPLAREKRIPPDRAVEIGIDAASALTFAEHNRIVHRDVKPANLLLANDGRVKLADLGLAADLRAAARA